MKSLSPTELQVAKLIAKGLQDKEIAERLGCSVNTVLTHNKHIKSKTGLSTRVEITLYIICSEFGKQFDIMEIREKGISAVITATLCFFFAIASFDEATRHRNTRSRRPVRQERVYRPRKDSGLLLEF